MGGIGGGGQQLFDGDFASAQVEGDDVGEGAADVDCEQDVRRGHGRVNLGTERTGWSA